ncbi:MAG: type VI secretion system baseplate subunit TssE [Massilia sp.]
MKGYAPTLLDRLMGERNPTGAAVTRLTMEQVKDSVARDLEALLNTRVGIAPDLLDGYPNCQKSIIGYGLVDFAGFCLSSTDDRAAICASLKAAIERHEPRLREVSASLEMDQGSVNRLNFVINATLQVESSEEPVNFNAVLQPSSLSYAITKAARTVRA